MRLLFFVTLAIGLYLLYIHNKGKFKFVQRELFTIQNIENPYFMFKWFIDLCELNGNTQLNMNVPYIYAIMNKDQRDEYVTQIVSKKGVVFNTPIVDVQCSAVLPPNDESGLKTTGLTTIICAHEHHCLPGSNVEIRGLPGLNGRYVNGVSLWNNANEKKESKNRVDVDYSPNTIGSSVGLIHSLNLIKDSSQLDQIRKGVRKGYLKEIPPEASISVTHRIYDSMPFNEWWSCLVSSISYLYGNVIHTTFGAYFTDVYGTIVSKWDTLTAYSDTEYWFLIRNPFAFDPSALCVSNARRRRDIKSSIIALMSLSRRGWINDPYHVSYLFESFFKASIQPTYNLINVPDIYGPYPHSNIIPALNYLEKGTVKNIYWGLDGQGAKTREQNQILRSLNLFNVSEKSVVGGTYLVSKLFDFINPFNSSELEKGKNYPDPKTWVLCGSTDTDMGSDRKNNYLKYYCGLVRQDISKGKRIGYFYIGDFDLYQTVCNGSSNYFSPPAPSTYKGEWNRWMQAGYSLMTIYGSMMKYLVGELKCESIIYDNRSNRGGLWSECLAAFFGNDRFNYTRYRVRSDTGYSPLIRDDMDGFDVFFNKIHTSLASTLGDCVFQGSTENPKKMIILNNYCSVSEGEMSIIHYYGDNADSHLGSNTYSVQVGSKTIGCVYNGVTQSYTTPYISSKIKMGITFSIEGGYGVCLSNVPRGPLYLKSSYAEGFWNGMSISSDIPDELKGLSGGTALRDDMSIVYYALGILPAPDHYFITFSGYLPPSVSDPLTWKDTWLEQSIREACSDILHIVDITEWYSDFHLTSSQPRTLLSSDSFIIRSGEYVESTSFWDVLQFNIQLSFAIRSGRLYFDPHASNGEGVALVPGTGFDRFLIGLFDENNNIQYGCIIGSSTFVDYRYPIGFVTSGRVSSRIYRTSLSFPSEIKILIMGGNLVYYEKDGYNMSQIHIDKSHPTRLKFRAQIETDYPDRSTSQILIDSITFR
jgi:hypothetical protein